MAYKFNALTGEFDLVGGNATIPEYTADPASPTPGQTWVRRTGGTTGGIIKAFIGGAFPVSTVDGGSATYELSFRTQANTTVRTTLS
jgi:hypothetical protein